MITPSFALTATERILPRMALDFTTATLDSRVTFTRSGNTATVINSSGFIAPINANLPRFDFEPIALTCKGLLIEESRQNIATENTLFSTWSTNNIQSVATSATTSVDGTASATKLTENTANGLHILNLALTGAINTYYTASIYAKPAGRNRFSFQISNATTGGASVTFDVSTGTITTAAASGGDFTNTTATISAAGNGWYRCTLTTLKGSANTNIYPYIFLDNGTSVSYQGDGTSGLFIYGYQMEAGAFATSVILTAATAVTRNADVATMTGANFSDWFNASEGAFVTRASTQRTATQNAVIFACHNTSANMIDLFSQTNNALVGRIRTNNVATATLTSGSTVDNATEGYAFAYKSASVALSNKSALPATNATAFSFTANPNTLAIGANQLGGQQINGCFAKLFYYQQRIINAETQAFSK